MIVRQPERISTAPEGTFPAVCVDEIPLGRIKTVYDGEERERDMVRLVWQLGEEDPNTKLPYVVRQDYTASLDEKSKLRKHLQSWRGRAFSPVELFGFDLETIVGAGCMLSNRSQHGPQRRRVRQHRGCHEADEGHGNAQAARLHPGKRPRAASERAQAKETGTEAGRRAAARL
jgi:hypothetical protein